MKNTFHEFQEQKKVIDKMIYPEIRTVFDNLQDNYFYECINSAVEI